MFAVQRAQTCRVTATQSLACSRSRFTMSLSERPSSLEASTSAKGITSDVDAAPGAGSAAFVGGVLAWKAESVPAAPLPLPPLLLATTSAHRGCERPW